MALSALAWCLGLHACGCTGSRSDGEPSTRSESQPAEVAAQPPGGVTAQPTGVVDSRPAGAPAPQAYDTTRPRPVAPRDELERQAIERGPDFLFVDRLVDPRTPVPAYARPLPPRIPTGDRIADGVTVLPQESPFADAPGLEQKAVSIQVGVARSTFRTRTREETLSAAQPFIDLVQRQVNVRGSAVLLESPEEIYYGLVDGEQQMMISHAFDYLLVRSWFANLEDNATVLLAVAHPARPPIDSTDRVAGSRLLLVVPAGWEGGFESLRGKRLAVPAKYVPGPGAFLTSLLHAANQPPDQAYFSSVTLRRYAKDALLDVLKGRADAACVDEGALEALGTFYGLAQHIRVLERSPAYNFDVLFTSLNNVATHQIEIELTQNTMTTLGKDAEGQEVLNLFDFDRWEAYRDGDVNVARERFEDLLRFIDATPVDLKPLLDPSAPVDDWTYDRYGDP